MTDNQATPTKDDATDEMERRVKAVESQLRDVTDRLMLVENTLQQLLQDMKQIYKPESQGASSKTVAMENQLLEVTSGGSAMENEVHALFLKADPSIAIESKPHEPEQVAERISNQTTPSGIEQHSEEGSAVNEVTAPASTMPLDLDSLTAEYLAQEKTNLIEDRRNLEGYYSEAQHWTRQGKTLLEEMQPTVQACNGILSNCRQVQASLPPELQEKLQGRHEGLDLIGKMLERLVGQAAGLAEDEPLEQLSPLPSQQDLMALLTNETNEEFARKALDGHLKAIGNQRWQLITKIRSSAQQRRKRFVHFVEKRVLPVLDGLDNGDQNSQSLIEEMKTAHPDFAESLTQWFETYRTLSKEILKLLNQVGVHLMEVKTGTPIDYERHEPFDVEPDNTGLQNEDLKEVVRKGYEYALDSNTRTVLRAAQVIVVKN